MKHNFFKYIVPCLSLTLCSCNDFLEVTPLNEIVADNYWTEKADVESVLYSCYSQLGSDDVLKRMFVWGELRSDNIVASNSTQNDMRQILAENILETTSWVNWTAFYQIINRCNTVIHYAPIVAGKDPNYAESEVKANIAEATFIRSLAYFYLARTFREVPYTAKPSFDDIDIEGDYVLPPLKFEQMLDQLIADLEAVKGDAIRIYPETSSVRDVNSTSRVTSSAIHALLADLYLWKQDYQKCVDYCNLVIDFKNYRYETFKEEQPSRISALELYRNKYPLIMEQPYGTIMGNTYEEVFATGNSFESIFEIKCEATKLENKLVDEFYGNRTNTVGQVAAYSGLYTGVYDKNNPLFAATDCRVAEGLKEVSTQYAISKYVNSVCQFQAKNGEKPKVSSSTRSDMDANWIIYRLTDVMLMKAEAEVELQNFDEAFDLVAATYNRANNFTTASPDTLQMKNYGSQQQMRELVLDERRRELLFEGKRWYDLVRYSLRSGDNTYMVNAVKAKQKERVSAIALQLSDRNALFWPYQERELDVNPYLKQNPAYITNESSKK